MLEQHLDSLNENQKEAVLAPLKPTLVLAGAGSGKTKVVTLRINYLLSQGFAPHEIVAITFTNKAAKEIQERVQALSQQTLNETTSPLICTFHSLCVHILRRSISYLGFNPKFKIYDSDDSRSLLKKCAEYLNIDLKSNENTKKNDEIKKFSRKISKIKNSLDLSYLSENETDRELYNLYNLYQTRLQESDALDFDDLLFLTVQLFDKFPEVASEYSNMWKALLIDEYQDTNKAQYQIAKSIVQAHQNIFAVGDPDQSIYSWRGANINNILNFEEDFPNATIIKLEKNYRSQSIILDAANSLIKENYRYSSSNLKKHLYSVKGSGELIQVFKAKTAFEEAEKIAEEIKYLHHKKHIPYKDMCIFFRTPSLIQSNILQKSLKEHDIIYNIFGETSLYKKTENKDILAYLKMLVSKRDFFSFERTIKTPSRSLGPKTIEILTNYARKFPGSILEACQDILVSPKTKLEKKLNKKQIEGLEEYCSIFSLLKKDLINKEWYKLIEKIIQYTKYKDFIKDLDTFEKKEKSLDDLVLRAEYYYKQRYTLEKFLEITSLETSLDKEDTLKEDALNLMTIHASKGLEFSVVFIIGLEQGFLPLQKKDASNSIKEERRLFYVAMTRAKDRLYLSTAEERFIPGRKANPLQISQFLREIPQKFKEEILIKRSIRQIPYAISRR